MTRHMVSNTSRSLLTVLVVTWHVKQMALLVVSRPSIRAGVGGMLINGYAEDQLRNIEYTMSPYVKRHSD